MTWLPPALADPQRHRLVHLGLGVMRGGLVAVVCILGVSWMGSSFFAANEATIVGGISATVQSHPWVFAVGLFVLSLLLFSQAAAIAILVPVGTALGLWAPLLVGLYPAVNGNFFLPTYGTVLAAVSFRSNGDDPYRLLRRQPQLHAPGTGDHERRDLHVARDRAPPARLKESS